MTTMRKILAVLLLVGLATAPIAAQTKKIGTASGEAMAVDVEERRLTVESADGRKLTFKVDAETKIVRQGQPIGLADTSVGDTVTVNYQESDDARVALAIGVEQSKS